MILSLKEYLIKFFGAKESFFRDGIKCKVDFKHGDLGFISSSLISKISFSTSFIPLKKVFPPKKKIELSYASHPYEVYTSGLISPNGTFKEAIIKFDKLQLDLKHDETPEEDFDDWKLLKKNKLSRISSKLRVDKLFQDYHEVYFHHDYEKSDFELMDYYNLSEQNYFLIKESKKIYFLHTTALEYADWISVKI